MSEIARSAWNEFRSALLAPAMSAHLENCAHRRMVAEMVGILTHRALEHLEAELCAV